MPSRETMECVCGTRGSIREVSTGTDADGAFAKIRCGRCGWQYRVHGLALIMWAYRASADDPSGKEWKSMAH